MKLYLVRHGETEWNRLRRFQGQIDIPLNDFGRTLALLTRQGMPVINYDRVYSSPLSRAYETACLLLQDRFPLDQIVRDNRIIEFAFGSYEGSNIDEAGACPDHPLYNCLWHPELYVPVGGAESFEHLISRAGKFLQDEIAPLEHSCDNVLIVAHGAMIRAFVCAVLQKPVAEFWGGHYKNCCVSVFDLTEGRFAVEQEAELYYDFDDVNARRNHYLTAFGYPEEVE